MRSLKKKESERFLEQGQLLNRQLRWMRFWNWKDWTLVLALCQTGLWMGLFLWAGPLIRLLDPSASVIDTGILSEMLLVLLLVYVGVLSAWLLLRLVRDTLTGFYEWNNDQQEFTKKISTCLEAKIIAISFWGLILLFVGLFLGLL
ncbi:hypothetical protein SAMN05216436_110111 [bacterium A37T11]|nr:hypothetical protein SAMN05216436_110111 [bacterium A37T11]